MKKPEDLGLTFLVVVRNYWAKDTDLQKAKKECRANGSWSKGERRVFRVFLVHQDTVLNNEGMIVFPSGIANETAVDLGEM